MSLYKPSPEYIDRMLARVDPSDRPTAQLKLALTAMLTGPTHCNNAHDIIDRLFDTTSPEEIADVLVTMGTRYNTTR